MVLHQLSSLLDTRSCKAGVAGTVAIALSLVLSGCGAEQNPPAIPAEPEPAQSEPSQSSSEEATSQVIGEPVLSDHALIPGRYCYATESAQLKGAVGLNIADSGRATGEGQYSAENAALGGPTRYTQNFEGVIEQDQLALELTTYIQEDRLTEPAVWSVANDRLKTEKGVYDQVDCSVIETQLTDAKQTISVMSSPYELEAEGLAEGRLSDASAPRNELTEFAEAVRVRRLSFAPGLAGGSVEDSVVRAHRDEYLVGAAAGQTMMLSISAPEQNASFGLVAPDGSVLVLDDTSTQLELPQSGDYSVVVGGTRGNASYDLEVVIR